MKLEVTPYPDPTVPDDPAFCHYSAQPPGTDAPHFAEWFVQTDTAYWVCTLHMSRLFQSFHNALTT